MRGDPLDLSGTFYMYTTIGTTTYIYCYNSSNGQLSGVEPVAGFLEYTSEYTDYSPVSFNIASISPQNFSLQSGNDYLGVNSSNIFDLVSGSIPEVTFSAPTSNSAYNVYNLQSYIYPSLPFEMSISGTSYPFYIFEPVSSSNWTYYVINKTVAYPAFFPSNNGQLTVWQTTTDYPNGACFYSSSSTTLGIQWLYDWTTGTSQNCDTAGALDSSYNNCYFSDSQSCLAGYVYDLCSTTECGNCLGSVPTSGNACYYNVPGSSIPLFDSDASVAVNTSSLFELDTTDTTNSSNGCSSTAIIIIIIFIILIIIGGFIYIIYRNGNKDNNKDKNLQGQQIYRQQSSV